MTELVEAPGMVIQRLNMCIPKAAYLISNWICLVAASRS